MCSAIFLRMTDIFSTRLPPRGSPWEGSAEGAAADAEGAATGTDLGAAGAALTGVAEAAPASNEA